MSLIHSPHEYAVKADDNTTILDRSPPAQPFVTGMDIASSIDAISGEFVKSPLDSTTISTHTSFSPTRGENFSFKYCSDVRELSNSRELGYKASITAPVEGIAVSANHGIDFSSSTSESASTILIIVHWELSDEVTVLDLNTVKLSTEATTALTSNSSTWRDTYGDYFVYGYGGTRRFSAVWKCTSKNSASSKSFKDSIGVSVNGPGDIGGSAGLQVAIANSAKSNNTTVEVQYSLIGGTDNVVLDLNDVAATFQSFRSNATSVPAYALLRHYCLVNSAVPNQVNTTYSTYSSLITAFSSARYALLMNGVAPGHQSARATRQKQIYDVYNAIKNARESQKDVDTAVAKLQPILDRLAILLARQDLVMDLESISFDDLCRPFIVYETNDWGAWIRSNTAQQHYLLGRVSQNFSSDDAAVYAVKRSDEVNYSVSYQLFTQQVGKLSWPGSSYGSTQGTAVGLEIVSNWNDGTDGWWCIPKENQLGAHDVAIPIKTEGSRGMDWSLFVTYIPDSEYTNATC